MTDEKLVPTEVPDIGGKTFVWVFENKLEFVDFCVNDIEDCTGFFKDFQEYCTKKIKDENSTVYNRRRPQTKR